MRASPVNKSRIHRFMPTSADFKVFFRIGEIKFKYEGPKLPCQAKPNTPFILKPHLTAKLSFKKVWRVKKLKFHEPTSHLVTSLMDGA